MVRLIISGCNGRMGRVVETICAADPEFEIVVGFDLLGAAGDRDFPIYSSPSEFATIVKVNDMIGASFGVGDARVMRMELVGDDHS